MLGQPFDSKHSKDFGDKLITMLLSAMGINNFHLASSIIAVIVFIIQVFSVGAKLISRRNAGVRAIGRVRFLAHIIICFMLTGSRSDKVIDSVSNVIESIPTFNVAQQSSIFGYIALITILWIYYMLILGKRKNKSTYFRGYGLLLTFWESKFKSEKLLMWLRLLDPVLVFFLGLLLLNISENMAGLVLILQASSIALAVEEIAYIYARYDYEMNKRDAQIEAKEESTDQQNTGY